MTANEAGHETASVTEDVKRSAQAGAEALREEARRRADGWTADIGARADHIADAIRSAGGALRGKEDWLADAADALGDRLARFSDTARTKDYGEIKDELERMARERPALFIGAAVTAGVALGRILRSSARHADSDRGHSFDRDRAGPPPTSENIDPGSATHGTVGSDRGRW